MKWIRLDFKVATIILARRPSSGVELVDVRCSDLAVTFSAVPNPAPSRGLVPSTGLVIMTYQCSFANCFEDFDKSSLLR